MKIPALLLWCVKKLNRCKDNGLAQRLHALADLYDTRPSGHWE